MVAIIDYDAGNIRSVEKAFSFIGSEVVVTRDKKILETADHIVLPGVGSFGDAMNKLQEYSLDVEIKKLVTLGKPFLGICLGMQLLFDGSDESDGVSGLGILHGRIRRIPSDGTLKVPQIGWNNLDIKKDATLFKNLPKNPYVYFVHSYYLDADDKEIVAATTDYGVKVEASIEKDNIFACQFHPEKSADIGMQILKNFVGVKNAD